MPFGAELSEGLHVISPTLDMCEIVGLCLWYLPCVFRWIRDEPQKNLRCQCGTQSLGLIGCLLRWNGGKNLIRGRVFADLDFSLHQFTDTVQSRTVTQSCNGIFLLHSVPVVSSQCVTWSRQALHLPGVTTGYLLNDKVTKLHWASVIHNHIPRKWCGLSPYEWVFVNIKGFKWRSVYGCSTRLPVLTTSTVEPVLSD